MKLFKTFLYSSVFIGLTQAQPVIGGLKIGIPITDAVTTVETLSTPPVSPSGYELGVYGEVRLPAKFSIEMDALHRGYTFNSETGSVGSTTGSSWEFPIVLKYHLLKGPVKPYVEGGLSFSHLSGVENLVVNHNTNFGVVLGAGVDIHALVLHISPEIRYTGNALKNFDSVVTSNQNQVAVLIGIGF
jgi:Outer membrane protein beta-barrel domain